MLTPSYEPIVGGTEMAVKNLTIKLNEFGVKTDIMTFNMNKKWKPSWKWNIREKNGFKIIGVPAFNLLDARFNPLRAICKMNVIPNIKFRHLLKRYDILHFHDEVDLSFPLISFFLKKPKIFHYHTLQETFTYYNFNKLCRYGLKKFVDIHIITSRASVLLLRKLGIDQNKIRLLPNGVDIQKFGPIERNKEDNLVLFVGRLQRRKGLHILLKSISLLETSIHIVIIGPISNHKYSKEIFAQTERLNGISNHEITYLGPLNTNDIIKWYQKASIFVCPSILEPFGIVNIEAMACCTPVVASNVDGIRDIIENYKNGILVPPNDPVNLARAIQYLLNNNEVRVKFGKEGRKKVESEFSWDLIGRRFCNVYEEMV